MSKPKPKIFIGVPCFGGQHHSWWTNLINLIEYEWKKGEVEIVYTMGLSSAVPDHNKNNISFISCNPQPPAPVEEGRRNTLTDSNRDAIVGGAVNGKEKFSFLSTDADYIFWLDDDTIPPQGVISHLVNLGREIAGGVYFLGNEPHNPVVYFRQENGLYSALYNYAPGTLVRVDSIGMGCTLIHRSVYERIMEGHEVFLRPTGTPLAIPKEQVRDYGETEGKPYVSGGYYHLPVTLPEPDDERPWPFYAMEYGRTEDHHFCELAANVDIPIYVDTTVKCLHKKMKDITVEDYKRALDKQIREDPDAIAVRP